MMVKLWGFGLLSPTVACHDCEVHSILIIIAFILYRDCFQFFTVLSAQPGSQRLQKSIKSCIYGCGLGELINTCFRLHYQWESCQRNDLLLLKILIFIIFIF